MSIPEIDFARIRPHAGSRNAGFEELCCQLAGLEGRSSGAVFYRKGRGGDAGVECFLRAADEIETGWQAKYVFEWSASLASQLDDSISSALEKHPKLERYIVCLPFDPPDARVGRARSQLSKWEAWAKKWKDKAENDGRKLDIVLWGHSALAERLARDNPAYGGRLLYWFDEHVLNNEWFRAKFEKSRSGLGSRYTPETNVKLPIRRDLMAFARSPELANELEEWSFDLQEKGMHAIRSLEAAAKEGNNPPSEELRAAIAAFTTLLPKEPVAPEDSFNLDAWREAVVHTLRHCRKAWSWVYELPEDEKRSASGSTPADSARHFLSGLTELLREIIDELNSQRWQLTNPRQVLLVGDAGTGKSHLLADIAQHHIDSGWPALLVLGGTLNDSEPWRQVMTEFDLPSTEQVTHFLASLDAAAETAGVRALICIDALNERHGLDIWPSRLAGFMRELAPFSRIGLILSCRTTYVSYVIPDTISVQELPRVHHHGFEGDGGAAAQTYLDMRGIVRPGAPNLVPEFNNPLFLKTCCDFLDKTGTNELPRGLRGITAIFAFYSDAVARALNARLRLDPRLHVVPKALNALVDKFTEKGEGYLDRDDAIILFEAIHPSNNMLERSLLAQLEAEGVLSIELETRDDGSHGELVRFTFERFSDHAIATRLLDDHLDNANPSASFAHGMALCDIAFGEESYRRGGVIEALAIQLPERASVELPDLFVGEDLPWVAREAFLESLLWREQKRFTNRTMELVQKLGGPERVNSLLIAVATEPDNIFNAHFLHRQLLKMPMPERDRVWSLFVAGKTTEDSAPIETLISWAFQNGMLAVDEDRAELAGIALSWLCSTSNRQIRDRATKALACLLVHRLALAGMLIKKFAVVDDLYVQERLAAAAYGAALQGTSPDLGSLAAAVYETFFESGAAPCNELLRDHARGILHYAVWRGKHATDLKRAGPPNSSPWPLEFVSDEQVESYKQDYGNGMFTDAIVSSTVDDGDFARYIIDSLAGHWLAAPIGTTAPPTHEEIARAWISILNNAGTEAQKNAFACILEAARPLDGKTGWHEEPDDPGLRAAEQAFRETITGEAWEDYRVRARSFVNHVMFATDRYRDKRAARFNSPWARRWVCKRAHDLGWTPERFGKAERDLNVSYDRAEHKIERVGKKYQWLALHDLASRMADNLVFEESHRSRDDEERVPYLGAYQVGIRDIDPSLLVARTHYDGWAQWPRTWWVPFQPTMRTVPPAERLAWRDTEQDLINTPSLIELTDPKTAESGLR